MKFAPLVLLAALALTALPIAAPSSRPDIVLITADDLGLQLGCYGDPNNATPALDRFAAAGTRFRHAYVTASSCSPSRASIFTGLYPHQNGQLGLAHRGFQMHAGIETMPALLRKVGYATAVLGKVHVQPTAAFAWDLQAGGMETGRRGEWEDGTRDVRQVQAAVRSFLAANPGPVFIMISFLDPHDPLIPQVKGLPERPYKAGEISPPGWLRTSRTRDEQLQQAADVYNCLARVDRGVDLVVQALREQGRERNALVIFLGDNGLAMAGGKLTSYESGTRTPFIVKWPGVAVPGQVRDEFVSAVDLLPTILEAAGVPVPERNRQGEGRSLLPLLRGETPAWRQQICTEMNFHTETHFRPARTIREGPWKLIVNLATPERPGSRELFNLDVDPEERRNLAGQPEHRTREANLAVQLEAWRRRTADPLLDEATLQQWAGIPKDPTRALGPYTPPRAVAAKAAPVK